MNFRIQNISLPSQMSTAMKTFETNPEKGGQEVAPSLAPPPPPVAASVPFETYQQVLAGIEPPYREWFATVIGVMDAKKELYSTYHRLVEARRREMLAEFKAAKHYGLQSLAYIVPRPPSPPLPEVKVSRLRIKPPSPPLPPVVTSLPLPLPPTVVTPLPVAVVTSHPLIEVKPSADYCLSKFVVMPSEEQLAKLFQVWYIKPGCTCEGAMHCHGVMRGSGSRRWVSAVPKAMPEVRPEACAVSAVCAKEWMAHLLLIKQVAVQRGEVIRSGSGKRKAKRPEIFKDENGKAIFATETAAGDQGAAALPLPLEEDDDEPEGTTLLPPFHSDERVVLLPRRL